MAEYNIGDKFIVEIINKTDEPLAPYINSQAKNITVYQLKGIPFMLDADTLSNFEKYEERKQGEWIPVTERLPEEHVFVLIRQDDDRMMVAVRVDGDWWYRYFAYDVDRWDENEQGTITHWMPLPEPPKEET